MTQPRWTEVDRYFADRLLAADAALEATLDACAAAGLPPISVSPLQGSLLRLLAQSQRARRILEIGTLGGYSTIWLAKALPAGGRLITLEADPRHAEIASSNIARAGLSDLITVRIGPALETLPVLAREGSGPFDLIFIDADKPNTADYFEWALALSRPGTLIVVDNVVRSGDVVDGRSIDPDVRGMRRFVERLAAEPRVTATVLQTVGTKGYDGFAIALVTGQDVDRRTG